MIDALKKQNLSEFTRDEFLDFAGRIFRDEAPTEEESNRWVLHFDKLVAPNSQQYGLIFFPQWVTYGVADGSDARYSDVEESA